MEIRHNKIFIFLKLTSQGQTDFRGHSLVYHKSTLKQYLPKTYILPKTYTLPFLHQVTDPDQFFPASLREAMHAYHFQDFLFLFLLGVSSVTCKYVGCGEEPLGQRMDLW